MSQTIPMITTAKLKCRVGKGMFPHEADVLIQGVDQCYESMIDRELIEVIEDGPVGCAEAQALIDVQVVKTNGTKVLVELPRQVVSGGRRIWVPRSEVEMYGHPISSGDCATP